MCRVPWPGIARYGRRSQAHRWTRNAGILREMLESVAGIRRAGEKENEVKEIK